MAIDANALIRQRANQAGSEIVGRVRDELLYKDHLATGELYNSISYDVQEAGEGLMDINIYGLDYFQFVDQGRPAGKQPPIGNILSWIQNRGIRPRMTSISATPRGIARAERGLAFLIARKIGNVGLPPANIMEETLINVQDQLSQDIADIITKVITDIIGENLSNIAAQVNNDVLKMTINYL